MAENLPDTNVGNIEYIRREDVLKGKKTGTFANGTCLVAEPCVTVGYIESLKPADVVPVVRCENCVHWSDSNQCERPELAGNRWHDDKYFETLPDDFCSYGERRGEQDGR